MSRRLRDRIRFAASWLAAGVCELPFFLSLAHGRTEQMETRFFEVFALHVLAASLLFFSRPRGKGWLRRERRLSHHFAFLTLFLPLAGWALSGLIALCVAFPPKAAAQSFEDDGFAEVLPAVAPSENAEDGLSREERVGQELDFLPLADILSGDEPDLKRGAIEKLALLATPDALRILLRHRSDASPEIRFYVTSSLARVKKEFEDELEAAKRKMQKDIRDTGARAQLARTYLRYARSRLLDDSTSRLYVQEAIFHLEEAIRSPHADAEVFLRLIEIHQTLQAWPQAFGLITELEKRHLASPSQVFKIKAEHFFLAGEYENLRRLLHGAPDEVLAETEWRETSAWWRKAS